MKYLSAGEKNLISKMNRLWESAICDAQNSMKKLILLGDILIVEKEKKQHGEWEKRLDSAAESNGKNEPAVRFSNDIKLKFGMRQAQKVMQIAKNKALALQLCEIENLSINELTKAISEATPEQIEQARQIETQRRIESEKPMPEKPITQKKQPEIIDGQFTEAPKKQSQPTEISQPEKLDPKDEKITRLQEYVHELETVNRAVTDDNQSMVDIFDAHDQLSKAVKEITEKNRIIAGLELRLHGIQQEKNEAIRSAKYWKLRAEKLEKAAA
jgi:hypothetical protein